MKNTLRKIKALLSWTLDCIKIYLKNIPEVTNTDHKETFWICNQTTIKTDDPEELKQIVMEHDERYDELLSDLRIKYPTL